MLNINIKMLMKLDLSSVGSDHWVAFHFPSLLSDHLNIWKATFLHPSRVIVNNNLDAILVTKYKALVLSYVTII